MHNVHMYCMVHDICTYVCILYFAGITYSISTDNTTACISIICNGYCIRTVSQSGFLLERPFYREFLSIFPAICSTQILRIVIPF